MLYNKIFTCKSCLWGDICHEKEVCEHFFYLMGDAETNTYIEERRIEFRKEWFDKMDAGDDEYVEDIDEWDKLPMVRRR